jgi:hypothetical protein
MCLPFKEQQEIGKTHIRHKRVKVTGGGVRGNILLREGGTKICCSEISQALPARSFGKGSLEKK